MGAASSAQKLKWSAGRLLSSSGVSRRAETVPSRTQQSHRWCSTVLWLSCVQVGCRCVRCTVHAHARLPGNTGYLTSVLGRQSRKKNKVVSTKLERRAWHLALEARNRGMDRFQISRPRRRRVGTNSYGTTPGFAEWPRGIESALLQIRNILRQKFDIQVVISWHQLVQALLFSM
jgi:hypothetical protein